MPFLLCLLHGTQCRKDNSDRTASGSTNRKTNHRGGKIWFWLKSYSKSNYVKRSSSKFIEFNHFSSKNLVQSSKYYNKFEWLCQFFGRSHQLLHFSNILLRSNLPSFDIFPEHNTNCVMLFKDFGAPCLSKVDFRSKCQKPQQQRTQIKKKRTYWPCPLVFK